MYDVKAYDFSVKVTADGTLNLPDEIRGVLPANEVVRVIVLIVETADADDRAWARLTQEQFLAGYSADDAIYDRI